MSRSNPATERPVDLYRIPLDGVAYQGEYRVSDLARLVEALADRDHATDSEADLPARSSSAGRVRYSLSLVSDPRGIWLASGEVEADLALACQRCFEPMPQSLHHVIRLGIVESMAVFDRLQLDHEVVDDGSASSTNTTAGSVTESVSWEPWLSEDGLLRIADVIEDELILALPVVNLHALEDCPQGHLVCGSADEPDAGQESGAFGQQTGVDANAEADDDKPVRESPFAVLKNLMD